MGEGDDLASSIAIRVDDRRLSGYRLLREFEDRLDLDQLLFPGAGVHDTVLVDGRGEEGRRNVPATEADISVSVKIRREVTRTGSGLDPRPW